MFEFIYIFNVDSHYTDSKKNLVINFTHAQWRIIKKQSVLHYTSHGILSSVKGQKFDVSDSTSMFFLDDS